MYIFINRFNQFIMSNKKIKCYNGTGANDLIECEIPDGSKLGEVRTLLKNKNFMPDDNVSANIGYRFVVRNLGTSKMNLDDVLIPISTEAFVPYESILGNEKQIIITNNFATKKPDLVGFNTSWWFNRFVSVQCRLNNSDPEAKTANDKIEAFQPLMLNDVIATSKNVAAAYDNVCVCCEGSHVQFNLSSWGAAGYSFQIGMDSGSNIVDELLLCFDGYKDQYRQTSIRRWQKDAKTIAIHATSKIEGILPGQSIRYQKVKFKTRRMTSFTKGSTTVTSNTQPPVLKLIDNALDLDTAFVKPDFRALANASNQTVIVPGQSIEPGTPMPGGSSTQEWGKPVSAYKADPWEEPLGEVVVYFFVFKTWEDAKKVIEGYNGIDPYLWT